MFFFLIFSTVCEFVDGGVMQCTFMKDLDQKNEQILYLKPFKFRVGKNWLKIYPKDLVQECRSMDDNTVVCLMAVMGVDEQQSEDDSYSFVFGIPFFHSILTIFDRDGSRIGK